MVLDAVVTPMIYRPMPELVGAGAVQPFPYQGSKRTLASAILPLMGRDFRLVEPFAGSAAVSLASKLAGVSATGVISDINRPLMHLWQEIITAPEQLADAYEHLWLEQLEDPRAFFLAVRDRFNTSHRPVDLLYLLNRIVKGSVRYSRDGRMNQGADNRRLGAKPATVRKRIVGASRLMQGTEVRSDPYEEVLASVNPATDVVYMDPPYQGTSNSADHRYIKNLDHHAFEDQLEDLVKRNVRFIVSYDAITTNDKYGLPLRDNLGLLHRHVSPGRSAQATLLGRSVPSVESLYISPALADAEPSFGSPSLTLF